MRTMTAIAALSVGLALPAAAQQAQDVTVPETDIIFTAPEVEVEGYEVVDIEGMTVTELEDEGVFSSLTNERIGEVDDVYTDPDTGKTWLGLEIGGFLDIGDKDITVPLDQVSVYRGDDYRVYIEATEEQIEAYPEYEIE